MKYKSEQSSVSSSPGSSLLNEDREIIIFFAPKALERKQEKTRVSVVMISADNGVMDANTFTVVGTILGAVIIGTLIWPVLEYTLHRFLGHELVWNSRFRMEHIRHHAEGNFFVHLHLKLLAAFFILGGIDVALVLAGLGSTFTIAFTASLLLNYIRYERFHMALHSREPKNDRELKLAKHHLYHHFNNYSMNHGVTSLWFDRLCKTFREPGLIKVPRHLAPEWLIQNAEKYAGSFQVIEKKKAAPTSICEASTPAS